MRRVELKWFNVDNIHWSGDRLITAPDAETLVPQLKAALVGNEIVLLKASRGVALERVLRHLT